MGSLADLLKDSRFWKDTGQGLTDSVNRGAIAGLLGGPVDAVSGVVNAGLMGLGYAGNKMGLLGADRMPQPIQKPVGGSEWIGDLLQKGGMVTEQRNAPAEMLAGLLAPSAVKGAGRAAFAAENNAMAPTPFNNAARNQLGATVWHGSPHKFDKFDSSKIGTGEGAQAYGHGLYLAQEPKVAQDYAVALSAKQGNVGGTLGGKPIYDAYKALENQANRLPPAQSGAAYNKLDLLERLGMNELPDDVLKYAKQSFGANSPEVAWFTKDVLPKYQGAGSLYKVDLPDEHIAKMLDWDKPLSQQHPDVQAALSNTKNKQLRAVVDYASSPYSTPGLEGEVKTMGEAIKLLGMNTTPAKGSAMLAKQGIPGIRYLDGGSRDAGRGTSNYVVFPGNEGLLSILERNGQPIK